MKHIQLFEEFLNEKNEYLNERTKFDVQKLLSKVDDELYNIIKWKDDASCYVSAPADAKDIIDAVKSKYPKSSWDPKTNLLVFESEEFLNEGKSFEFTFNYNTDKEDVFYIQNILMSDGIDAIAEPGTFDDEMIVKAKNAVELRRAKKAIQADGFEINESAVNEEINIKDIKVGTILNFKDGETWKVTKTPGISTGKIFAAPYGDTRKSYISIAIEYQIDKLKQDVESLS